MARMGWTIAIAAVFFAVWGCTRGDVAKSGDRPNSYSIMQAVPEPDLFYIDFPFPVSGDVNALGLPWNLTWSTIRDVNRTVYNAMKNIDLVFDHPPTLSGKNTSGNDQWEWTFNQPLVSGSDQVPKLKIEKSGARIYTYYYYEKAYKTAGVESLVWTGSMEMHPETARYGDGSLTVNFETAEGVQNSVTVSFTTTEENVNRELRFKYRDGPPKGDCLEDSDSDYDFRFQEKKGGLNVFEYGACFNWRQDTATPEQFDIITYWGPTFGQSMGKVTGLDIDSIGRCHVLFEECWSGTPNPENADQILSMTQTWYTQIEAFSTADGCVNKSWPPKGDADNCPYPDLLEDDVEIIQPDGDQDAEAETDSETDGDAEEDADAEPETEAEIEAA